MADFGQILRQERERRGIALDDLARAAKVGRHHLEALESNDLARLPGGPFNKGFVRAYARHVGLDPELAVDAYTREERAQGLRTPDADREMPSTSPPFLELRIEGDRQMLMVDWLRLRHGALLLGGLLAGLVAAAALLWLVRGPSGPEPAAASAVTGSALAEPPPAPIEAAPGDAGQPPPPLPGDTGTAPDRGGREPSPAATRGPDTAPGTLQVTEAALGTGLAGHDLAAEADRFQEGEQAWFWTRSTGGRPGLLLRHVWLREGRVVATYDLTVGGPHWRNASRKTLTPGSAGAWQVEARDAGGRTLASAEFVCLPARPSRR